MNPISSQLHRSILPAVNSPTSCLFNDLTCFVRDVGSGMTLRTIDYSSRVVSNTWLLDDQVAVYDWLVMSLLHLFAHLLRLIA